MIPLASCGLRVPVYYNSYHNRNLGDPDYHYGNGMRWRGERWPVTVVLVVLGILLPVILPMLLHYL